ncbi:MAG: hypothetical protein KKB22_08495, partial [Candidatus Omnitrophica bacterium]|nr:hypothetical protein [Candidatus Omnitrophota bacterium]
MIFIFIGYMEDLISCSRLVKDICNKQPGQDYFIVSMNRFTDKLSNETGLPIRYIEEFLNKEDYEYMESTISKLCDTWHLDCRTRAKDLADILQWEAYVLFCTALKN